MLSAESLEIQDMLRAAMRDRRGSEGLERHFRAFDTICSATQDRQDAVHAMLDADDLDVMIVVGGYNSSNTQALASMCAPARPHVSHRQPGQRRGVRDPLSPGGRRRGGASRRVAAARTR